VFFSFISIEGKSVEICDEPRGVAHGFEDSILHAFLVLAHISGNHNLEGYQLRVLKTASQPDSREAAIAEFVLNAVLAVECFPDANRIVQLTAVCIAAGVVLFKRLSGFV
jgi:hypothetical protein